jgi:hypothetical protein
LYIIAGAEMEGRETATEGQRKAAAYIEKHFKSIGLIPNTDMLFSSNVYSLMRLLHLILDTLEYPFEKESGDSNFKILVDLLVPSLFSAGGSSKEDREVVSPLAALDNHIRNRKAALMHAPNSTASPPIPLNVNKSPPLLSSVSSRRPHSIEDKKSKMNLLQNKADTTPKVDFGNINNVEPSVAVYSAIEVSRISSSTVFYVLQMLIEECPRLLMNSPHSCDDYCPSTISYPPTDNVLNFMTMACLILLHGLCTLRASDMVLPVFDTSNWILRNLGFPVFNAAMGDTLQDWIRECMYCCIHEHEIIRNVAVQFIIELMYGCFHHTASLKPVTDVALVIFQEFVTTLIPPRDLPPGVNPAASMIMPSSPHGSSADAASMNTSYPKIETNFNIGISKSEKMSRKATKKALITFIKSLKSGTTVCSAVNEGMRASFNVSLAGFVSDVEAVVIAYENLIHQVNVFVPFDYFGSNTLDGPHALYLFEYDSQLIQKRFLLTSDSIRAKAECNEAAALLCKAAHAFNPLTHPRFHMFWLENMAMLHELVGNVAESAEVRRRIFEVCKDVQYTRDNLWSQRPPILWKSRRASASAESLKAKLTPTNKGDSGGRDFYTTIQSILAKPRQLPWQNANQYNQHLITLLNNISNALSSAGLIRSAEKTSELLLEIHRSEGKFDKLAEEYARLGNLIKSTKSQGLDTFSLGNYYRVYYTGLGAKTNHIFCLNRLFNLLQLFQIIYETRNLSFGMQLICTYLSSAHM